VWSNNNPNSLTFPPGATTGARIEINGTGIRVYDEFNNLVWELTNDFTANDFPQGLADRISSLPLGLFAFQLSDGGGADILVDPSKGYDAIWDDSGYHLVPTTVGALPQMLWGNGILGYNVMEQYHLPSTVVAAGAIGQILKYTASDLIASDNGSNYNTGLGIFTIPVDGMYSIVASIHETSATAVNGRHILAINDNASGNDINRSEVELVNGRVGLTVACQHSFQAGDAFTVQITNTSAGAYTANHNFNTLSVKRIMI